MRKQAFTLVELIVTIGILAILSTIGFMSFSGYKESARDSNRVVDLGNLANGLNLYKMKYFTFPEPSGSINITYSGGLVWKQGSFGKDISSKIRGFDGLAKDPLTGTEYAYSLANNNKEYQLASLLEEDTLGFERKTFAGNGDIAKTYIKGNYNGYFLNVSTGSYLFTLTVPSLFTNDITLTDLQQIVSNNKIVYNGSNNLPVTYIDSDFDVEGNIGEILTNDTSILLHEGDINNIDSQDFVQKLQNVYTGGILVLEEDIKDLLSVNVSNKSETDEFLSRYLEISTSVLVNGSCGADNGGNLTILPTNLCNSGIPSGVTDNGEGNTYNWTCNGENGGTNDLCSANHLVVTNGACGSDNGQDLTSTPTNLCSSGVPSGVADNGEGNTYNWNCNGTNGGSNISCNANHVAPDFGALTACLGKISGDVIYESTGTSSDTGLTCSHDIAVCSGNGTGIVIEACDIGIQTPLTSRVPSAQNLSEIKFFQWGNNYPFSRLGNTIYHSQVDASGFTYGTYNSSTFINRSNHTDWSSSQNDDLWGDTTDNDVARKGPCSDGYHVPTMNDWTNLINYGLWTSSGYSMLDELKMGYFGYLKHTDGTHNLTNNGLAYFASTPYLTQSARGIYILNNNIYSGTSWDYVRSEGTAMRCFKNP